MCKNENEALFRIGEIFQKIAKNDKLRKIFIRKIVEFEKEIQEIGRDFREEITGPIVDFLFARGEILSKKLSDGTIFEFPYLSKIARDFVMSDPEVPDHVWEPQTTKLMIILSSLIQAKHIIIAGAYFGEQAIPLAKKMEKWGGIVHAFEPNELQFEFLKRNIEKNNIRNIISINKALWDISFEKVYFEGDDAYASLQNREVGIFSTETITIEDYSSEMDIESIDLIVLDIEGSELRVLKGAEKFLSMNKERSPIIIFEIHRKYVDWTNGLFHTDIIKFLSKFEYEIYAIRDIQSNQSMKSKPIELIPLEKVYLEGPPHGFNLLAIKNLKLILDNEIIFIVNKTVSPKLLRHGNPLLHHPMDGF